MKDENMPEKRIHLNNNLIKIINERKRVSFLPSFFTLILSVCDINVAHILCLALERRKKSTYVTEFMINSFINAS